MDVEQVACGLVRWIQDRTREAGAKGVVLGISGGIDSAVVAALAKQAFPDDVLGLIMPSHSQPRDAEHAWLVAEKFAIPAIHIDLTQITEQLIGLLDGASPHPLASANIRPRLRMICLYYQAQKNNYLVLGTGNRTELYTGYFTKYGDGGVDLLPIGGLVKAEVRELARFLGVPQEIIEKPPSAGLWEGQTDEGEIGLTYEEMDRYLLTGQAEERVRNRMEHLHRVSEHKRSLPPIGSWT